MGNKDDDLKDCDGLYDEKEDDEETFSHGDAAENSSTVAFVL